MKTKVNKVYLWTIVLLMFIFPLASTVIEYDLHPNQSLFLLTGKWFIFWGLGIRLFTAGIRQIIRPELTLQIFHIENLQSQVVVKELGFANICTGLVAILALFIPAWLSAAAFVGGLYMGIAGLNHIIKKSIGINEVIATVSDVYIFVLMMAYLYNYFLNL